MNGTATDPSGAAVAYAIVTISNVGKGTKETAHTNESGNYLVQHLIPDTYKVRVEAPGFTPVESKEIQVSVDYVSEAGYPAESRAEHRDDRGYC